MSSEPNGRRIELARNVHPREPWHLGGQARCQPLVNDMKAGAMQSSGECYPTLLVFGHRGGKTQWAPREFLVVDHEAVGRGSNDTQAHFAIPSQPKVRNKAYVKIFVPGRSSDPECLMRHTDDGRMSQRGGEVAGCAGNPERLNLNVGSRECSKILVL